MKEPGDAALGLRRPGGEPLWTIPKTRSDICLGACITANRVKQAAPGNNPPREPTHASDPHLLAPGF